MHFATSETVCVSGVATGPGPLDEDGRILAGFDRFIGVPSSGEGAEIGISAKLRGYQRWANLSFSSSHPQRSVEPPHHRRTPLSPLGYQQSLRAEGVGVVWVLPLSLLPLVLVSPRPDVSAFAFGARVQVRERSGEKSHQSTNMLE